MSRRKRSGLRAATLGLVLAVAGCASSGGQPDGGPAAPGGTGLPGGSAPGTGGGTWSPADPLVREVAPFPVLDEGGDPYDHPFLGGFDVPRPQLADVDGDGDFDLFIQERTDELIYFENAGTAREARFRWRTDRYQGLEVGEWSRFHDLDDDGDLDLLAESKFSYIRYFRNEGGPTQPRFVPAADTLYTPDGEAVFSDRQNIPNLTDIDCDGRVDLFLGRVDGTVTRYEEAGLDDRRLPRFEMVTDRFQDIEIVAAIGVPGGMAPAAPNRPGGRRPDGLTFLDPGQPGAPADAGAASPAFGTRLHGANSMVFADIDDDGDQDFFWGDFFEPGLLWIENLGSCAAPDLRATPEPVPARELIATSGYNASALADMDADGDEDLLIGVLGGAFNPNTTAADNLRYYEKGPDGLFVERSLRYLDGIDVGSESYLTLGDLDGDGDDDMLLGSKLDPTRLTAARLYHFENTGTASAPSWAFVDTLAADDTYHLAPVLADLDADGDQDVVLGTWNRGVRWMRNQGTAVAPDLAVQEVPLAELSRGSHATPALGDLDGDGDLDLVVGESSGELNFFRNVGSRSSPVYEEVTDNLGGIDVGRRAAPALVDGDGDGDLDLVVGSEDGGLRYFRNDGTAAAPDFVEGEAPAVPLPPLSTPVFRDVDGDGDLDLLSGGMGGGVVFHRNGRGG